MRKNSRHPTGQQEKGGLRAAAIVGAAASHAIDNTGTTLKLPRQVMGKLLSVQAFGEAAAPSIQAGGEPLEAKPRTALAVGEGTRSGAQQRPLPLGSTPALQG